MQRAGPDIIIKHVSHLVETLVCDGHPGSWQLLLAPAGGRGKVRRWESGGRALAQGPQVPIYLLNGSVQLLDLVPQLLGLLLQGRPLLLQHGDVLGRLLQSHCFADLQASPVWTQVLEPSSLGPTEALRGWKEATGCSGVRFWAGGPQSALWFWGCQTGLRAHLEAGLGTERAHQPMQGVKPQFDIEAPLLLRRDVGDATVLSLGGQKLG